MRKEGDEDGGLGRVDGLLLGFCGQMSLVSPFPFSLLFSVL
jgi:hypothetical protein